MFENHCCVGQSPPQQATSWVTGQPVEEPPTNQAFAEVPTWAKNIGAISPSRAHWLAVTLDLGVLRKRPRLLPFLDTRAPSLSVEAMVSTCFPWGMAYFL